MSHVKKVAIVGATGSQGKFIVDELLKLGKHEVTAITRVESKAVIPEGVKVAKVDYEDHSSLVAALRGQEVLIITMSVRAPNDAQKKLIDAAADAEVPWILPNDWGLDTANDAVADDIFLGPPSRAIRKHIDDLGKSSWIAVACGFWYEFSLGGSPDRFGFNFAERSVVFFDDGTAPIHTSTWPQVGRAVAKLLSLKTHPGGEDDKSVTLSSYKGRCVRVSSFDVSQRDMFESVLRVTGTRPEDWKITHESSAQRYREAADRVPKGDFSAFARAMYTRVFFPDGSGRLDREGWTLDNAILGLPREDLDEYTRIGIEMEELPAYDN
ncbi:hypothetical protein DL764_007043 [Monosporascus ibericus]|uniref:NmrA-like domain-containing protein n=1 Tax=Monosporascus ibericus TaxID=155417 RepID=A0A4Q4T3H8_9PEZI|nr:hypothetical protein DL764_007043 [Monosporascus ibericus]